MRGINRNAAFFFFRSIIDLVVPRRLGHALFGQNRRDSGSQRGLPMVDVTNRAYVHVRFGSLKFILSHLRSPYTLAANVLTEIVWITTGHGAHDRD